MDHLCFLYLVFSCCCVCSLLPCATCWDRADLLAFVGDVIVLLYLSHMVAWVRCGT